MQASASWFKVPAQVLAEIRAPAHAPVKRGERGERGGALSGGRCLQAAEVHRRIQAADVHGRLQTPTVWQRPTTSTDRRYPSTDIQVQRSSTKDINDRCRWRMFTWKTECHPRWPSIVAAIATHRPPPPTAAPIDFVRQVESYIYF